MLEEISSVNVQGLIADVWKAVLKQTKSIAHYWTQ